MKTTSQMVNHEAGVSNPARERVIQTAAARPTLVPPRSTIFAGSDDMTVTAAGRQAPTRLSVIGFDDTPLAESVYPPLTSAPQPAADMTPLTAHDLLETHAAASMNAQMNDVIMHQCSSGSKQKPQLAGAAA